MTSSVQRKHGVGFFNPVSWNKGRRYTSPGPGAATAACAPSEQEQRGLGAGGQGEGFFNSDVRDCLIQMLIANIPEL